MKDSDWLQAIPENALAGHDEERQIVLKAVNYYADGMTPFDAFHAATAETEGRTVLSSEQDYDEIAVERVPLEPQGE